MPLILMVLEKRSLCISSGPTGGSFPPSELKSLRTRSTQVITLSE